MLSDEAIIQSGGSTFSLSCSMDWLPTCRCSWFAQNSNFCGIFHKPHFMHTCMSILKFYFLYLSLAHTYDEMRVWCQRHGRCLRVWNVCLCQTCVLYIRVWKVCLFCQTCVGIQLIVRYPCQTYRCCVLRVMSVFLSDLK